MARTRLSIAGLMVAVVAAALNLAAARVLYRMNPPLAMGLVLSGPLLEFGLVRLWRRRGGSRAFWAGLIACGLLATLSFLWAMLYPTVYGIDRATGKLVQVPGSLMWSLWSSYAGLVTDPIMPLLARLRIDPETSLLIVGLQILLWSFPQLAAALAGGFLARLLFGRRSEGPAGVPDQDLGPRRLSGLPTNFIAADA